MSGTPSPGRADLVQPPRRSSVYVDLTWGTSRQPAALNRQWRNRPCPCTSFCPCSHCRLPCNRPCLYRSSGPCKHAFPSQSCQSPALDPAREATPPPGKDCSMLEPPRRSLKETPKVRPLPLRLSL